jgi:hypothetical protein
MLGMSLFSPAYPWYAKTHLPSSGVLDTREAYLVNMPRPALQEETNDASQTTYIEDGFLDRPASHSTGGVRLGGHQVGGVPDW